MRVLLVLVAVTVTARPAAAGECPQPRLQLLLPSTDVPTNAQVRVMFEAPSVPACELVDEETRQIKDEDVVIAANVDVALRTDAGRSVAVTVQRTTKSAHPIVIAIPKAPLEPTTRYAVVMRGKQRELVVAHFT